MMVKKLKSFFCFNEFEWNEESLNKKLLDKRKRLRKTLRLFKSLKQCTQDSGWKIKEFFDFSKNV